MDAKQKSRLQEALLSLYLRLNGYFVTGLIVHSPIYGRNQTEVDLLAVRFPHNCEPERRVDPDPLLETSSSLTDLLICEVKSKGRPIQFNDALRENPESIATVLRWAGLYAEAEVDKLAPKLAAAMSPSKVASSTIPRVEGPRSTQIRCVLCVPERDKRHPNQRWFLPGAAMLHFIDRCVRPTHPRTTCSTAYDLGLWGSYEEIVGYAKNHAPVGGGTVKALYSHFMGQ